MFSVNSCINECRICYKLIYVYVYIPNQLLSKTKISIYFIKIDLAQNEENFDFFFVLGYSYCQETKDKKLFNSNR